MTRMEMSVINFISENHIGRLWEEYLVRMTGTAAPPHWHSINLLFPFCPILTPTANVEKILQLVNESPYVYKPFRVKIIF